MSTTLTKPSATVPAEMQAFAAFGDATRHVQQLIETSQGLSEFIADMAMVRAKEMLTQALTPEIRTAMIAAGTAGQYELIGSPSADDVIAVCIDALAHGLRLQNNEFAVYPCRGKRASLYIKAAGYLKFFRRAPEASTPVVHVGHPVWTALPGSKDKTGATKHIWCVDAKASCQWGGNHVAVVADGQYSISVPGFESDGIDNIKGKATRRILRMLWDACGGAPVGDVDDDADTVIDQTGDQFHTHGGRYVQGPDPDDNSPIEDVNDPPSVEAYRKRIKEAETVEALKAVGFLLKEEPEFLRAAMRADYVARQQALELDIEDLARTLP